MTCPGRGHIEDMEQRNRHAFCKKPSGLQIVRKMRREPGHSRLLQRALRSAPDGLPQVSTFTILYTLHEAGYSWQKNRTWCHTGRTLKKGKDGTVYQSEDPYKQEKKR